MNVESDSTRLVSMETIWARLGGKFELIKTFNYLRKNLA